MPLIITLRDGAPVLLRPFAPEDRDILLEAFNNLSPDAHYYRFWNHVKGVPDSLLNRILNSEPGLHESWGAQDPARPNEPGYGGASYWRNTNSPSEAEVSFIVADEAQHRGIATALLAVIWLRAKEIGVTHLYGHVLPDNYTVLDWFRSLGASFRYAAGTYTFTLSLDEAHLRDTPTAARFKTLLSELKTQLGSL